jgi:1,4-alpha-glucan branching enzyme
MTDQPPSSKRAARKKADPAAPAPGAPAAAGPPAAAAELAPSDTPEGAAGSSTSPVAPVAAAAGVAAAGVAAAKAVKAAAKAVTGGGTAGRPAEPAAQPAASAPPPPPAASGPAPTTAAAAAAVGPSSRSWTGWPAGATTTRTACWACTRSATAWWSRAAPGRERVVARIDGAEVPLEHLHAGVWQAEVPGGKVTDYRLDVTYHGTTYPADDPYRYLPTLGEVDLHLIARAGTSSCGPCSAPTCGATTARPAR